MNKPRIGFIGQGFVGKNTADDFEERGYTVVRYALKAPYSENKAQIKDCDIVLIAVPTPTTPDGFSSAIVEEAVALVGEGKVAVIKSTVLPGTTKRIQEKHPEKTILFSPEFLSENTAAEDARNPFMVIVGYVRDEDKLNAEEVLSLFPDTADYRKVCTAQEAEMIKYAHNTSGYVQIVFVNILYTLAERLGCNWEEIQNAMEADPFIPNRYVRPIHKSGRGAGGHCFIKDFAALRELAERELPKDIKTLEVIRALEEKNKVLLQESNKDAELLRKVYGE